jgi:hypothetical protein
MGKVIFTPSIFLQTPPEEASAAEVWAFYNAAEKEAKARKEDAAKQAMTDVSATEHKFIRTSLGGAQLVNKVMRKPKDSLKFFLQQHQVLEVCKKDEIDLKKVDELIEAGMLPKEDTAAHIVENKSSYLQLKK